MTLEILEYPMNIRTRPGQYLGSTENCTVMFKELIDNASDEHLAGHVNIINIQVDSLPENNNRFIVADNSNTGFSLDETHINGKKTDRTTMDSALNMMSSSTKFRKDTSQIGQNGVGSSATNALSMEFYAISNVSINKNFNLNKIPKRLKKVYSNEKYYILRYEKGIKKDEYFSNELPEQFKKFTDYSTIVSFIPDLTILDTANYELPKGLDCVLKVSELSGNPLKIILNDEEYKSKIEDYEYFYDVKLNGLAKGRNPSIRLFGSFELDKDLFIKDNDRFHGAVNSMACHSGQHIRLFRDAYKDAFVEMFGIDCDGLEDMGLKCQVYLMANEVDFDSQSKTRLSKIYDFDMLRYGSLRDKIKDIFKEHEEEFLDQYNKIVNFRNKKGDLNRKQAINHALGMDIDDNSTRAQRRSQSYKPKKLKDAWSQNRKECELLVFEGDSASGSAHKTRDAKTQAIFPLRGVPVNTSGMDILDVLKHEEMKDLMRGIGAGVEGHFNLEKCRYDKIIYCGDMDSDGQRIQALIIGLFLCHARFLIEAGKVYVCETPFWIQNGKYIYADEPEKLDQNKPFKRIKGLGGLGKDFHNTVTNKKTRRLVQVTIDGANEAIQVLRSGGKKKELLMSTGVVSEKLWEEK